MTCGEIGLDEIIVVRHGQTEWNRVERFRGRRQIPLNETGLRQAEQTAAKVVGRHISRILASPLARTMQTADPISRLSGCPVTSDERLIEADHGAWEGLTPEEAQAQYPQEWETWLERPQEFVFPKGESLVHLRERVAQVLREVAADPTPGTAVLMTHKLLCKLLVSEALGVDTSRLWLIEQDNACIDVLVPSRDRFIAYTLNDTCHLKG